MPLQKKHKVHYDTAYDGYNKAINSTPMLKNSNSMARLTKVSGITPADMMRNLATEHHNRKKQKAEEERLRQEERLAELQNIK